jgi:hypothetical protein
MNENAVPVQHLQELNVGAVGEHGGFQAVGQADERFLRSEAW